jgi:hypothetical protein
MAASHEPRDLRKQRRDIARKLARNGRLLRGSLTETYRTCGNPRCKCARGEKHGPYLYVSVYEKGRTRLVYVPRHMEQEVREWVANVRHLEEDLRQITQVNVQLLRAAGRKRR